MTSKIPRNQLLATVIMPAGTYYVGDPCYSVADEDWIPWLEASDYVNADVLQAEIRGHKVLGFGTLYGDGTYEGTDGFKYPVDAGLIGLVPVEVAGPNAGRDDLVTKVTFDKDVICYYERGTITLGHIEIDTEEQGWDWDEIDARTLAELDEEE